MADYRYLIVGGGMTAHAACRGIREHDTTGSIAVVGAEEVPPYKRPPLTKALWKGDDENTIWLRNRGSRRRAHLGTTHRLARSRGPHRHGRTRRVVRLRAPAARDGRPAEDRARLGQRCPLLPYRRRLPDASRRGRRGHPVHRHRRRLHRIGDRGGAAHEWLRGDTRRPGAGHRGAPLPRRALGLRHRLLPRQGCRGARRRDRRVDRRHAGHDGRRSGARGRRGRRGAGHRAGGRAPAEAGLAVDDGIVVDELGRCGGREDVFAAGDVARFPATRSGWPCASSTRTTRTATGARSAPTWPARASRTTTCRSSTPISSTSATRRSARSTRATTRWASGTSRTARAWSPTSTPNAGRAASCSGTSGARSTPASS